MARQPRNYTVDTRLSSTVADMIPTVIAGVQASPSKLSFYNSSATLSREVTVHLVESGGSADTGNILTKKTIAPEKPWNVIEIQGEVLTEGMKLQASQAAGTDVNANCSGSDFT